MSSDEITPKHLRRLRARGAPATATGGHDVEETWRQTVRGLVVPVGCALTLAALRAACARLTEVAERQQLALVEEPLFGLRGDPGEAPPDRWDYEAVLPVRGAARPEGDVTVARVEGGLHLAAITPRGLDDLKSLYGHLLGKVLPSRKQRLARPYILHRVHGLTGRQGREPDEAVAVYVPAVLSMKPVPVPADEAEG
ncbi:hypothetical protein WME89_44210 [Sorangium sp. So ce321]|uniref:hypothetical protein n=1 Tax=Sorangium sp. So ce321 TaxID=3133300 RepID=UPI003F62ED78